MYQASQKFSPKPRPTINRETHGEFVEKYETALRLIPSGPIHGQLLAMDGRPLPTLRRRALTV